MSDVTMGPEAGIPDDLPVVTMKRLAAAAYQLFVDEAFELQQRIVLNGLIRREFGNDALPARDFIRRSLHRQDVLTKWQTEADEHDKQDRDRLAGLLTQIRALEVLFRQQHDRDQADFIAGMEAYFRQTYGKGKGRDAG